MAGRGIITPNILLILGSVSSDISIVNFQIKFHPIECFKGRHRGFTSCLRFSGPSIGRTPKGAYSTRGRSRHLLETAFSEPLLRTLLRTLFPCKTHSRPPSQNPSENPSPEPCPEPSQNPSQNAVLPYAPLGVHPIQ